MPSTEARTPDGWDYERAKTVIHRINRYAKQLEILDADAEAVRLLNASTPVRLTRQPTNLLDFPEIEGGEEYSVPALTRLWVLFDAYLVEKRNKSAAEAERMRRDADNYWAELEAILKADCEPDTRPPLTDAERSVWDTLNGAAKLPSPIEQRVWDLLNGQALTAKETFRQLSKCGVEVSSDQTVKDAVGGLRAKGYRIDNPRDGRGYRRPDALPPT